MSKKTRHISAHAATVLAFCLSLVVFGGIVAGWILYRLPDRPAEPTSDEKSETVSFTKEDAVSVLLILTDGDRSTQFVWLQADPTNPTARTVALPAQTSQSADHPTLETIFLSEGPAACCDAVSDLLDVDTPVYAVMDYTTIETFVDDLPRGLIYTVEEPLSYQDAESNYFLRLETGLQTLTGDQTVKLLRYPAWKQGKLQQVRIHAVLVAAWWNQYATAAYVDEIADQYADWYNLVDTNFKIAEFTDAKAALAYMWEQNDGNQCTASLLNGAFSGNGNAVRYIPK